jgi:hypothetical protein
MPKTLTLSNTARKKVPPTMMSSPKEDTPSVKVMHRRAGPVNTTAKKQDNLKPPATLVKTWLWMARDASDYELKKLGRNNIIRIFGSVESAHDYIANGGK